MLSRAFIKGEERELLIAPSLFIVAKDKGWKAEISDTNNLIEILEAYNVIILCAIHNARRKRQYDEDLKDIDLTLMDIVLWQEEHPNEYGKVVRDVVKGLSGFDIEKKKFKKHR